MIGAPLGDWRPRRRRCDARRVARARTLRCVTIRGLRALGGRTSHRALLAAVGVAALLVSLAACSATSSPTAARPIPTASPTSAAGAAALAQAMLAGIVLPGAARFRSTSPAPALDHPSTTVNCPHVATAHAFWTVSGYSTASMQRFLEHHVPHRLQVSGTGYGSGPGGSGFVEVTFAVPASTQFATLDVTAVPQSNGVAIRADAEAILGEWECSHA